RRLRLPDPGVEVAERVGALPHRAPRLRVFGRTLRGLALRRLELLDPVPGGLLLGQRLGALLAEVGQLVGAVQEALRVACDILQPDVARQPGDRARGRTVPRQAGLRIGTRRTTCAGRLLTRGGLLTHRIGADALAGR